MITKLLWIAAFQIVIAMLIMLMLNLWERRSFMKRRNTRRIYPKDVEGVVRYMDECIVYYRHRTVWNLFRKNETFKLSGTNYYDSKDNLVCFEEGLKWN